MKSSLGCKVCAVSGLAALGLVAMVLYYLERFEDWLLVRTRDWCRRGEMQVPQTKNEMWREDQARILVLLVEKELASDGWVRRSA